MVEREQQGTGSKWLPGLAYGGALCLWLAFPPVGLWFLGPVGVACWVRWVAEAGPVRRREWLHLFFAGWMLWLGLLQGIRLAYWPLYAGWVLLAAYLALFVVAFVLVARRMHGEWKVPIALAAPVVWVGWECFRARFLTGFAGCMLGHSVAGVPWLTQIAEHVGGYGISAGLVMLGVGMAAVPWKGWKRTEGLGWSALGVGWVGFAILPAYGLYALQREGGEKKSLLTVALIQDNSPTMFDGNPELRTRSWFAYLAETERAVRQGEAIDVIVWPESVFTRNEPIFEWTTAETMPREFAGQIATRGEAEEYFRRWYEDKARRLLVATRSGKRGEEEVGPYYLMGSDVLMATRDGLRVKNAALWIDPQGVMQTYYAKQHLVPFGEFLPLGYWLQPMLGMGIVEAGRESAIFECRGARLMPSICFENMVPHDLQRWIAEARGRGEDPDILINVSNDGWFHGSSMLDHHLACGTIAAVENRRPMLIAANTGLSAWIDGSGRRVAVSKRLAAEHILAKPWGDGRRGAWSWIGDWPARLASWGVVIALLGPLLRVFFRKG